MEQGKRKPGLEKEWMRASSRPNTATSLWTHGLDAVYCGDYPRNRGQISEVSMRR